MKPIFTTGIFCAILMLTGCGSMLATFESNKIEDEKDERTLAQQVADETIETKAIVNIRASDDAFDGAHLVIVSYNGFVLLAGQVGTEELKSKATDVVRDIQDVRRIYNEMDIASPSSAMSRTSDTWITTKVKSWLLGSPDIEGSRVKVVTENSVVYLMGIVTAEESERISDAVAGISGVQRVVKLFETIKVA